MQNFNTSLSRLFTKKVFYELLTNGTSEIYDYIVRQYVNNPEDKTNGEIISEIYLHMSESYRGEYFYLNTLLNKLLVGIHNVNTTTALSQLHIANHIADFVMINGEGHVYEIKSDLDNLNRLNAQLSDYFKAFSFVSVLSSERDRDNVERQLERLGAMGKAVGIYVLSAKDKIFNRKNTKYPKEFNDNLDSFCMFTLLRKKEYENILSKYYKCIPQVAPAFYFKECFAMFRDIPILEAQKMVMEELKKRNKITRVTFNAIPLELKSIVYFHGFSKKVDCLNKFLNRHYGG